MGFSPFIYTMLQILEILYSKGDTYIGVFCVHKLMPGAGHIL